jgi:S1-C subfamily serine protease
MKNKFLLIAFLLVNAPNVFCQNFKPTYQSNYSLDFSNFLSGVKYAYLVVDEKDVNFITNNPSGGNALALLGVLDYLKEIGFSDVNWGTPANTPQNFTSLCDLVRVSVSWGYENSTFTDITMTFVSCNNDIFKFTSEKNIWVTGYTDIKTAFYNKCLKMYGYKKNNSPYQRLKLPSEMTEWTEQKLKSHFLKNGADPVEGIYEGTVQTFAMAKYKLGVIKTDNGYTLVYLDGANNYQDWTEGEVKAKITKTATPTLFKASWKMGNKFENNNAYISFETGLMNLVMQEKDKSVYLKLFPTPDDNVNVSSNTPASGTGFGITSNGLIVTNSHVINGATKISVRGINGDFSKLYSAKLLTEDKNNDLAIIQINDPTFVSLGSIPFTIAARTSDVGSSVFALGYPMKSVMGDEIKLTNGIISSKSGFQGDVTSYQISVPLQPGNSGGPLFDANGYLVGVVNARLTIGENVSYAIKSSYLTNLLDLLAAPPKLQTINSLTGKQLTEQVKILNKFVYIIEVN